MKDNGHGFWWVFHRVGGELVTTRQPYRSKEAAKHYYNGIRGGEKWLFHCESDDPGTAKAMFRDAEVKAVR